MSMVPFVGGMANLVSAGYHEVAAGTSVVITVDSLIEGHYLESRSAEELMHIAETVKEAVAYTAKLLHLSVGFNATEELYEF